MRTSVPSTEFLVRLATPTRAMPSPVASKSWTFEGSDLLVAVVATAINRPLEMRVSSAPAMSTGRPVTELRPVATSVELIRVADVEGADQPVQEQVVYEVGPVLEHDQPRRGELLVSGRDDPGRIGLEVGGVFDQLLGIFGLARVAVHDRARQGQPVFRRVVQATQRAQSEAA